MSTHDGPHVASLEGSPPFRFACKVLAFTMSVDLITPDDGSMTHLRIAARMIMAFCPLEGCVAFP